MNKSQKAILINFVTVIVITTVAIIGMINLKAYVNHSEAARAMTQLGERIMQYRKDYGVVPPQSYVDRIKEQLQGYIRLGELQYRAQWIDFDSTGDEILAYAEQRYTSLFLKNGFLVLRLDGRVHWMDTQSFETLLQTQIKPGEDYPPIQ